MHRTSSAQVKICGITSVEDATFAIECGAAYCGLIFAETSQRKIDPDRGKAIASVIGPRVSLVGVFQNQNIDYVREVASFCALDLIQLHGSEDPLFLENLKRPAIKSFEYRRGSRMNSIGLYSGDREVDDLSEYAAAKFLLFDKSKSDTRELNKTELQEVAQVIRTNVKGKPFFFAGSLNPDNVVAAIAALEPYGVDVCSGVEQACRPGKKSYDLTERFCALVADRQRPMAESTRY